MLQKSESNITFFTLLRLVYEWFYNLNQYNTWHCLEMINLHINIDDKVLVDVLQCPFDINRNFFQSGERTASKICFSTVVRDENAQR